MSSEEEDKVLFEMYHINGYDGSVGSPDTTIDSVGAAPVDIVRSEQVDSDVDMRRF